MNRKLASKTVLILALVCSPASAGLINVAVDIDTTRTASSATGGSIMTQPGFTSWNLTNVVGNGSVAQQLTLQGVTFDIFGIGNNQSRFRSNGGGGPFDSLLRDFVFHEGVEARAIGLRIFNLPVGTYEMQSWHYDSDSNVRSAENFIQVEARDQGVAGSTVVLVDKFPFSTTPTVFRFEVTNPSVAKEIIFREDDAPSDADPGDQNRARLNGFTLRTVPEPSSLVLLSLAAAVFVRRFRAS